MRTPKLYLMIGPPGSGKTSYIRQSLSEALRVSLDDLRLMFSGRAFDLRYEPMVSLAGEALMRALLPRLNAWGIDLVFDATNVTRELRARNLAIARDMGLAIVAIFLDTPIEIALERNRQRRRKVPEDVIYRFYQQLQPPTEDEGFAEIVIVRNW